MASNAQYEQRHDPDAAEQCRECHRIVFEPMPIREHDIIPLLPPFLLGLRPGRRERPSQKTHEPRLLALLPGAPLATVVWGLRAVGRSGMNTTLVGISCSEQVNRGQDKLP
jgi:hypothetical protein